MPDRFKAVDLRRVFNAPAKLRTDVGPKIGGVAVVQGCARVDNLARRPGVVTCPVISRGLKRFRRGDPANRVAMGCFDGDRARLLVDHDFFNQWEHTRHGRRFQVVDSFGGTAEDEKPTYIFAAWNMKMGKNLFVVNVGQFTKDEKPEPAKKGDTFYYALGMYHNFSKTTSVFGGYRASDADNDSMSSVFSLGLKKKF